MSDAGLMPSADVCCCSLLFRGRFGRALHPWMWARSSRACGLCRTPHRVACHDDAGLACCCNL